MRLSFSAAPGFRRWSFSLVAGARLLLPLSGADSVPNFFPEKIEEINRAIERTVAEQKIPGGVFWLERHGSSAHRAFGNRSLVPQVEAMTDDTIFDAASLTKVLATSSAIMLLVERGMVRLDDPAAKYLTEFQTEGKEQISLRHLLTHTSGLRPDFDLTPVWNGKARALELLKAEKPANAPGRAFVYSDINFIALGEIVERTSGVKLEDFVQREIFKPLKMTDTSFLPPAEKLGRIAPTERADGEMLRGRVHDPTARRMGGVAGHAGLFTTAGDLARFARMILGQGELEGARVFQPETVRLMTSVQSPEAVPARRGLGWDIDSPYSRPRGRLFPLGSFGHTGFTGTCLWIDPFSRTFWFFLSSRLHPDGRGNVLPLQAQLATLSAEAVPGFNFAFVPGALTASIPPPPDPRKPSPTPRSEVLNGIDVLARSGFKALKGLKLGLITNHTGRDKQRRATIDLLREAPGVELKVLFSPEHGIRGQVDEKVSDSIDEKSGLPIYSLYGESRKPKPEQLAGLDALVFDIQDIGARFYTYAATMGLALEAAAARGLQFFILDRVNPINGAYVEGPVLSGEPAFTGFFRVPVRHGLTVGELGRMLNAERELGAKLTVVRVEGWHRRLWLDQTGLPWTNPSPNMRNLTEAMLYPGIGLLETAALSVGRGTDTPFELIGAPYIDDLRLAAELNAGNLPGIRFVPVRFKPAASVFKGEECGGVQIILTDRETCRVVEAGIFIAETLHRLYPKEFKGDKMNSLLRHPLTLEGFLGGKPLPEIRKGWEPELEEFLKRRQKYLLYD